MNTITIENFADKAPELVAYMQSVAQKQDDTFPSFGNIRVMYVEEVDRWAIDVDYTTSDPFYNFSSDKQFAELVQDVVNKFCNKPYGLNIIVKPHPEVDPMGDRAIAILPGFNSEAEFQEWHNTTKYYYERLNEFNKLNFSMFKQGVK